MTTDFHHYLLEEANKAMPTHTLLAQELLTLLPQSKANIYKKIKGEVPFSALEAIAIARKFGISLDRFIHNGHSDFEKVSFDYSLPQHQPHSPAAFLEKVRLDLERIVKIPQVCIHYASNEVPLFHSLTCRNLLAFKLYVWSRTNWKCPDMPNVAFDVEAFYALWPDVEKHRQAIASLYRQIPSKEYWSRTVLDNILNQIRYYTEAKFFKDPGMPEMLLAELRQILDTSAFLAAEGTKGAPDPTAPAASFELFLNEIAYTNNIILIYSAKRPIGVYATMDNPNFLRCVDPVFCQRMHLWIKQVEECSFHVSSEQHRLSLFRDLYEKVKMAGVGSTTSSSFFATVASH